MKVLIILAVICSCLLLLPVHANSAIIVSVGNPGDALAASATFEMTTYNFGSGDVSALMITLTNTSTLPTANNGNVLTGLLWTQDLGTLPTGSAGFDGTAVLIPGGSGDIAPAVSNNGQWVLANNPGGTAWIIPGGPPDYYQPNDFSAYSYGLSTAGIGIFSNVDGEDYGIVAAGTDLSLDGLPNKPPKIDQTAIFYIAYTPPAGGGLPPITMATFLFGTAGGNVPVPIPSAAWLIVSGLIPFIRLRRKRSIA